MSRRVRNILIAVLAVAALVAGVWLLSRGADDFRDKYAGADLSADVTGISRENTYDAYLSAHGNAPEGKEEVAVDLAAFEGAGEMQAAGFLSPDEGETSWKVEVPAEGLYNIRLDYLTTGESRGIDIEREVRINGELPFSGASKLSFSRLWTDAGEVRTDNQGNEIRPSQVETFDVQTAYFRDDMGSQTEPYAFFFKEGENVITLKAVNEPMILCGMALTPIRKYPTYAEYAAAQPEAAMTDAGKNFSLKVQGESSKLRSTPSLYARYDRSSSLTEPSSVTHTVLNYLGGDPWTHAGEWIEWDFEVQEDG